MSPFTPILLLFSLVSGIVSQSTTCSSSLQPDYPFPTIAEGFTARLVINGLTEPRGITIDSQGALLVVEQGVGISAFRLTDGSHGCVGVDGDKITVVADPSLNHGIALSADGNTLYASSADSVYSWDYSPSKQQTTSRARKLITGMLNDGHTTRTLLLPRSAPDLVIVSRGSEGNLDPLALEPLKTGHAQIKAFNLTALDSSSLPPYDFTADGALVAWGVRNGVGLAEHPHTGGIWEVENSVDEVHRLGRDIHQSNPGEKLNSLGRAANISFTNDPLQATNSTNFGYPTCVAAWDPSTIPSPQTGITRGTQFSLLNPPNDPLCQPPTTQPPHLVFHPHTAPLDLLFNPAGTTAWTTFHGSWNAAPPVGYSVSAVAFDPETGEPAVAAESSTTPDAEGVDVLVPEDVTRCPRECLRPVGLAWGLRGELWVSADDKGEVWVLGRRDGGRVDRVHVTGAGKGKGKEKENGAGSSGGEWRNWRWGMTAAGVVLGGWT